MMQIAIAIVMMLLGNADRLTDIAILASFYFTALPFMRYFYYENHPYLANHYIGCHFIHSLQSLRLSAQHILL